MKLNLLATVVAAAASLVAVNANAYQAEVGGTVIVVSPDAGKNQTGFGLDGTYYFNGVQNNSSQPLAEQAFLQNASNVAGNITYSKDGDNKTTTGKADVTYFIPNTQFAAIAGVSHRHIDGTNIERAANSTQLVTIATDRDTKVNTAVLGVGYKPTNNLLLKAGVGYAKEESDTNVQTSILTTSNNSVASTTATSKTKDSATSPFLGAKLLTQVGGKDVSLAADAILGDIKTITLGADYYLDRTLSVGVGYKTIDTDASSDDAFSFRAKKFFTNEFSLEGSASFGDNENTYGVRGAYRF